VTSEAEKRSLNAALRPGDLHAERPEWLPALRQAQAQMSPSGIPLPPGIERGTLWLKYWMIAATGYVKWYLYNRTQHRGSKSDELVLLGYFVTEYLPDDKGSGKQKIAPCTTHGKRVTVNHKITGENEREVIVYVDDLGLATPVPPEWWKAHIGPVPGEE
jgi:hypothetical protein